jgi:two-component system, NarL family, sensor histidine kinase PprA
MDDVRGPDPADPARLTRMNRLATEARLVAGLAHELNNSLQVVGGLVELLATRTDLPSDAVARLEKVSGQTDKATSAIRRVVGYSRERPAEPALVDLASVVDQALALRQYQLGRLGVAAIVDRGPNGDYRVRADERQLTQAVLNLVLNAEEALASSGSRQLQMTLTGTPEHVRLAVSDNGSGVNSAIRDRIFEPYFSTNQSERALGLGLPVSRAIVEAHGGKLWLSDDTPGATFVIELPASGSDAVKRQ